MLSIFPIHYLSLLAYTLLRLFIAGVLFTLAISHTRQRRGLVEALQCSWLPFKRTTIYQLIVFEYVLATLILFGAWTQLATLLVAILSLKMIIFHKLFPHPAIPSRLFYVLLLGASLTLTITGAGVFSVDLPI